MPFLSPNQQCQSTEGKKITFHGFAYPKLTGGLSTLSLTTNSSWLPWGRVAMPLISPLIPALIYTDETKSTATKTYGQHHEPVLIWIKRTKWSWLEHNSVKKQHCQNSSAVDIIRLQKSTAGARWRQQLKTELEGQR